MNDRLRIAAMNVTAMLANDKWQTWAPILISRNAVVMADALLAAAGEKESVSIMSQPVSRIEYDKQVARAYAAEGIVDDLKAQLTAALEDNERLRGGALNVAYGNMFARAEAAETEAQRLRDLVESGAQEIAALQADNQKMHHDWMAEHAELEHLKDELAKHTEPLTDEQVDDLAGSGDFWRDVDHDDIDRIDAAIRAAREGAR